MTSALSSLLAEGYICIDTWTDSKRKPSTATDYVIYIQGRNEPALVEPGDNLGAMISELKSGESISEYVGAGLKNYGYKTVHCIMGECKTVCKVRGITLNYSASQLVNFEMKDDFRRSERETVTVHTENKRKRVLAPRWLFQSYWTRYAPKLFNPRRIPISSFMLIKVIPCCLRSFSVVTPLYFSGHAPSRC
jgi:hypothetical protein